MYRFLKVCNLSLGNTNASTKPAYMQTSSYLCSFCKFYHPQISKSVTYQQLKHHSTTINPSQLSNLVRKKSKARTVKYVELLEVTDSATKDGKTAVKKLNAANLSSFVDQIDSKENYKRTLIRKISLARKYHKEGTKLENKEEKYESVEKFYTPKSRRKPKKEILKELQPLADKGELTELLSKNKKDGALKELDSEEFVVYDQNLGTIIKDNNFKMMKKHSTLSEENYFKSLTSQLKQESQHQYLLSYFETCSKCGKMEHAFKTFLYIRKTRFTQIKAFRNIVLYNFFLREFALRGDLKSMKNLTNLIKEDLIKMSPDSYAFIFECVARSEDPSTEIDFLTSLQHEMNERKISLNDIVTKPIFVRDQLEKVLLSVRLLKADFKPSFKQVDVNYSCHLLGKIFENRMPESPAKGIFLQSDLEEKTRKQLQVEFDGQVDIKSIATSENPSLESLSARKKVRELEEIWRVEARKGFERSLESLKLRERGFQTTHLHPYLTVLDKEEYVNTIMREVKRLAETAETFSPPINYLSRDLGQHLFKIYETKIQQNEGLIDKTLESYGEYCKWYLEGGKETNGRVKWQLLEQKLRENGNSMDLKVAEWPFVVMRSVGRFLFDIILKDLKIMVSCQKGKEIFVPAFYVIYRSKFKHTKEEIKPHPGLTKLYRDSQPEFLNFDATLVPSLSPPRPWSSFQHGGYLITKTSIIRVPFGAVQQWKKMTEIPEKQMYPSLDCLNQLGTIPWKVNTSILDVAVKVFQDGGSTKLNVPQPPSVLPPAPLATEESTEEERSSIFKARMELKRRKNEMYSLWCDALYKLSLANHYRNEIFWLPHNMDFRGRVYPIPPHLSQMGSDFARSLLVFAQEKPLGPKGLDWLKIHIINLTGFRKKESVQNRLKYADEILDKILDSAENPLTGEMWWATSDEPWQTLSACMEISKALKSPDPTKYSTGFPIHQDGSCNGLQHYAALGRDQIGAESVNLHPFEKPHDVYSDVVVLVEKGRKLDAENGVEIAQVLDGFIQRKVIKQTIMTTVYGVTKFGAKLQIAKQLKDIEDFPQDKVWPASGYLVQKTFESLRSMFTSAKEIQDWFTECARAICSVTGKSVEWVTPLGLPIVQPYTKPHTSGKHQPMDSYERPNVMKQKNAFPPNFVHSLDSTHMMLTSLHCEQAGITFMSVHDCFWTHPCTVKKMNQICRKQFIALHSEPILENLSQYLLSRFSYSTKELEESVDVKTLEVRKNLNEVLARVPKKGTFDLEKVQSSTYFFS